MARKNHIGALLTLSLAGCGAANHTASYQLGDGVELRMELEASHPYLAEYDRTAVLARADGSFVRHQLQADSGGFSTTNVYRCSASVFMLVGYFDEWIIDSAAGTIKAGRCSSPVYTGVFDGSGSAQWRYYSAPERPERLLAPTGG